MIRLLFVFFFFKQKTAYEMRISDWSSDVCSSDLVVITLMHMKSDLDPDQRWNLSGFSGTPRSEVARAALDADSYVAVAEIDSDSLDDAYMLTQNGLVSDSWSRMPPKGVTPLGGGIIRAGGRELGYKSTEVGDVMLLNGKAYVVDTLGFAEIEGWEPPSTPMP